MIVWSSEFADNFLGQLTYDLDVSLLSSTYNRSAGDTGGEGESLTAIHEVRSVHPSIKLGESLGPCSTQKTIFQAADEM